MNETRDFSEIIYQRMSKDADFASAVRKEKLNFEIACHIHEARVSRGWSQAQLAERAGMKQSVISRLEDADYDGRSLNVILRIAEALDLDLKVEFKPRTEYKSIELGKQFEEVGNTARDDLFEYNHTRTDYTFRAHIPVRVQCSEYSPALV